MAEDHIIISRADAKARGLTRYFTGNPCKYGHIAERHTASGTCGICAILVLRKRYKDNPDYERKRATAWYCLNKAKARAASSKYKKENPEKRKAAVKRWRQANPEKVREINRRASLSCAVRNPKRVAENKRKWMAVPENRAARTVSIRAWRLANPEKDRAIARNRRAKLAGSIGTHTATDLAAILKSQNYRCVYCPADLRKVKRHVDHIVPISRGGLNDKTNLQYTCSSCNVKKNAKDPIAFAQELGRLL
jgi:5-methylcytosine-specific restriction endonuclease McrA